MVSLIFYIIQSYRKRKQKIVNFYAFSRSINYVKIVWQTVLTASLPINSVKRVRTGSFTSPYFPSFGMNKEIYSANLRIRSE